MEKIMDINSAKKRKAELIDMLKSGKPIMFPAPATNGKELVLNDLELVVMRSCDYKKIKGAPEAHYTYSHAVESFALLYDNVNEEY